MKFRLIYVITWIASCSSMLSCKKNSLPAISSSSLTIVNALSGGYGLIPNFDSEKTLIYYKNAAVITNNGFLEFSGHLGNIPLSLAPQTDTLHTLYKNNILMEANSIHTLFVTGTIDNTDSYFTTDKVPAFAAADSLIGVRFVNISMGSKPVSINIKGQSNALVNGLAYKSASDFLPYAAKKTVPATVSYVFEIRDASTAALITTYTLSSLGTKISKSVTIALKGIPGGTGVNAQMALLVNNY
ncbi:hypothetical protein SAMN05192574_101207 [Mucilaginibacter gossypiicola]|uniref:DUF4397 domain-containing protein n=1 Tax=Mucilaginibacter gossypiicola TaxID=551995 RepID=A0A1H7ZWW0_9SPHI|nr:DUF4397 domain-containing protein [Mucilaginibacter gossypiicola]SEM62078.1 hypothetical protein SAMN05192574_101207 [Mucilaginibacter gossypiicola]